MGTDKNCILEGSLQHKFSYIMWGHVGQVLAIAPHPSDTATFATGGANDRMVVKWRKQRVAWKLEIQSAICSLSWHTNGKVVVAGTEEGNLMALNGESGFFLISFTLLQYRLLCWPKNVVKGCVSCCYDHSTFLVLICPQIYSILYISIIG